MKPYDKVSSFRGANTLLQGQQINGQDTEERTQKTDHRRQINRQIKAADPRRDQHRSKDQSGGTRTVPRRNVRGSEHIVKERL
jgi:hypothetical protein